MRCNPALKDARANQAFDRRIDGSFGWLVSARLPNVSNTLSASARLAPVRCAHPARRAHCSSFRCSVGMPGLLFPPRCNFHNDLPSDMQFQTWPVSEQCRQRAGMALETEGLRSTLTKASAAIPNQVMFMPDVPRTIRVEIGTVASSTVARLLWRAMRRLNGGCVADGKGAKGG